MRFNQPIQSGNSRNISVKNPAFFAFCYTVSHNHTTENTLPAATADTDRTVCLHCPHRWPCVQREVPHPSVPPSAAVSHVRAAPASRAQRHTQPRLPGLVVLVEVQSKAQEPKALIRTGCQQDQELLDDSLKGKEKPKRQLRKHPWCVLHRNVRWGTDLVKRQRESGERQAQGVHTQQLTNQICWIRSFCKNPELHFYFSNICHACQSLQCKQLGLLKRAPHSLCPAGTLHLSEGSQAAEQLPVCATALGQHSGPNLCQQETSP